MGRPERPLDPQAGPVQRLAHDLRELRRAKGSPSYRAMAQRAGFSASTLSQAAAGERLPSLAVVRAYALACGGDPGEWEARWKEAEAADAGTVRENNGDTTPPYRGLARFELDDHELFFGRGRMVEELRELMREHRFAVLFGPSGGGKSSLLRAGVIPRLREESAHRSRPAVLRLLTPGARPAETYGHLLTPAEGEPESWIVVDQFEEVFTLCRDRVERQRFIDLLLAARAPDSRLRVLVAVRADFHARCAEHRDLADALFGAGLLLGPMTADELREVIVRPAQAVGLLVERELTTRIVKDVVDQPGALPMLSHALLETWQRRKGRMLTLAAYEAAGGVRGAIAATAEDVYGQLSPDQARVARQLLLRMVEPGRGTADTRRPLTSRELAQWSDRAVPVVVERLARARLIIVDEDAVQLAHEALISSWPRLTGWIEENRERLRHHRNLTEAARVWLEHNCEPEALYRGSRLAGAEELFTDDGTLTTPERAFLTAALDAREAERRAAVRTARRSRFLIAALSIVLAVALIVGLTARNQARDNERQRTDTAARRVAAVAGALRTTDPRTAMLLGVASWRISPLSESRRALLGSLVQREQDIFTPPQGDGSLRSLADSGRTLISFKGRSWRTWDVATHRQTASGRVPAGERVVDASVDGRVLAVDMGDGWRLWDTATDRWTGGLQVPADHFVTFGADSRSYLVVGNDLVQMRSVANGRLLFEIRGVGDRPIVTPSGDGRLVAVCPAGRPPQIWEIGSRRVLSGAWERAHGVCYNDSTVWFGSRSEGGDRFAVMTPTGVRVWDTRTGRQVADIADPGRRNLALGRKGAFLATLGYDEIRVWRLSNPASPVLRYSLTNQQAYPLAWDPARPVLRYIEGGTVHSLDTATAVTPAWRDRPLAGVLLSPDARTLATATRVGNHYRFELRDTRDGHVVRTLPSQPLPLSRERSLPAPHGSRPLMAFSPDGTAFAYGVVATDGRVAPQRFTVWDLSKNRARTTLDLAPGAADSSIEALALGPGGRTLCVTRIPNRLEQSTEAWDTARHRRTTLLTAPSHIQGLVGNHLAVRPDGRLLVADNHTAALPAGPIDTHDLVQGDLTTALAFASDGSQLAAGDRTGRVALWDGTVRERAGILANVFPPPLQDVRDGVSALALSPDGRTLAVGGDSGSVQLWDVATQQPLGDRLPTPGDAIATLAFSPDSGTLYAGSLHVPLQRYVVDPQRAVTVVCGRVKGDLTERQWRAHVENVRYRRVCG
ncbi:hypothetical protein ABZX85_44570 [Streptomyces sp. NPDC004539]|uniref:nSTAND1 domain-containing NTPase n=1 Tax=Streptomyces sp. NPDC004539 TaxID=3154280 RepID=UPI0033B4CC70